MATLYYPVNYPNPFCMRVSGTPTLLQTPSTCFEAKDPTFTEDLRTHTLYAEGTLKIWEDVYPEEVHDVVVSFQPYDEPLFPIPVGASVFYYIMIAWMTTFYFTYLGRKILSDAKNKLDLHPESVKFPSLPLYWIQQSKREAELRREVRNTWAWLARRYLLSPNDPLLDNVDQVLGLVNWHDFEVSRTTWSLIRVILTVNALYVKVKRDRQEKEKRFDITKDITLAKARSREKAQVTRVFEEGDGKDEEEEVIKPRERALKFAPETKKPSKESVDPKPVEEPRKSVTVIVKPPPPPPKILKKKKKKKMPELPPSPTVATEEEEEEEEMPTTTDQMETEAEDYGSGDKNAVRRRKRRRRRRRKVLEGERRWLYFYKKKGER